MYGNPDTELQLISSSRTIGPSGGATLETIVYTLDEPEFNRGLVSVLMSSFGNSCVHVWLLQIDDLHHGLYKDCMMHPGKVYSIYGMNDSVSVLEKFI